MPPPPAAGLIDFPVPLPSGVVAYFRLPPTVTESDFSFYRNLLGALRPGLVKITPKRTFPANATWANKDQDVPVRVLAEIGLKDGIQYYKIEGSDTGIPATELFFS